MPKMLRFLCCLLSFSLLLPLWCIPTDAETAPPSVSAQSAVLLDPEHGIVLWEKNGSTPLPIASTTKIMTALVALNSLPVNTVVRISSEAVGVEGSSVYLTEGEKLTLEELLYALLLESANDAAVAIALAVSGSIPKFAEEMNRTAQELGLKNTRFQNPHGLPAEEHYASAADLARITAVAMEDPLFAKIVATPKATISHGGKQGVRLLLNHNKMLHLYNGAVGVKTGFTKKSGRCLVSAAERDGVRLIAVTLNAPDDWNDHTALLDYGFSVMRSTVLCRPHEVLLQIPLVNATTNALNVSNPEGITVSLPQGHPEIKVTVEAPRFLFAPVKEGDRVGTVIYKSDLDGDGIAECIGATPLLAQTDATQQKPKKTFWQWLLSLFGCE